MLNKHFATKLWFVALMLLTTYSNLSAQTPSASITTWKDDRKSAYTIVHDDWGNTPGVYDFAFPLANARGIKFSFGAITSICDDTEWAQARAMIAQGHECINHSHSHKCAICSPAASSCRTADYGCGDGPTFSAADFATELTLSDNLILQNTGKKARFFIFPYDRFTSEANDFLANSLNYLGGRSGLREIVNEPDFAAPFYQHFYVYGPGNQTTVAELNAAVNEAINTGSYVMREFHEVGAGSEENSWGRISVPDYTSHLNFLKTKMDAKLVWSATNTEVMTYKMQREVYQPTVAFNAQTGIIAVAFAQDLSKLLGVKPALFTPSVFTTPITLKVDVTGITGALSATAFQNGVAIPYTRSGNILLVNVYPHNGVVTINSAVNPCNNDTQKPVFANCPANITVQTATATATTAVATWTAPTATDNCGTPSVSSNFASGAAFPIGTTTVTYTATDAKGNTAIPCSFTVTVTRLDPCATDAQRPVFANCPVNITVQTANATATTAIATWTAPTATDNCGTPSVSSNFASSAAFPIGVTTVTYNATDAKGNTAIPCSFTVTVTRLDPCATDAQRPVFANCPVNITVQTANATATTAIATWTAPTATDNCGTPSVSSNFASGAAFPIGTTTVTYTATDAKGNTAIPCSFTVTVTRLDPCATDTEKPVFANCPANISIQTAGTTAIATWTAPTATDNCGTPSVSSNFASGAAFPIGTTTVTYTATDAKGNTAIPCSFTVTVTASTLANCDAVQVLDALNAINITGLSNTAVIQVFNSNWSLIGSTTTSNPSYLFNPITVGTYNVIVKLYRVASTGWTPICSKTFRIQVTPGNNNCLVDTEKPRITNCPSNITVSTAGTTAVATWIAPFAVDNCTNPPTITSNFNSGASFPLGLTTVTYNAVDAANNAATPCSFTVNVVPNTGLVNCEAITINGNNGGINIGGLSNTAVIQVFNSQFKSIYNQTTTTPTVTIPNLKPGTYIAKIKLYRVTNGWSFICEKNFNVVVSAAGTGAALTSANVLTLNAQLDKERVQLNWAVNTGDKTDYFVVQKQNNTTGDFDNIETINNTIFTDKLREFTYFDEKVLDGETKYRIKQVFTDGNFLLSETAKVEFKTWENVAIFPNPVDDKFNLILKNYKDKDVTLYLYNSVGHPVHIQKFDANALLEVDASNLPQGHYLVRLVAKGKRDFTKQIFVAH
jgi:peptidoglycan/xylan/chitin deacetylase (PgdA/CDA1 family)